MLKAATAHDDATHARRRGAQRRNFSVLQDSELEKRAEPLVDAPRHQSCRHAVEDEHTKSQRETLMGHAEVSQNTEHLLGGHIGNSISKELMRQRLAYISTHYPAARPSRGNLKEVYKFARLHSSIL